MNLRKIVPVMLGVVFLWVLGCTGQTSTTDDYLNQGLNSAKSGDLKQAIENFSRALDLDSENLQAYHNRGFASAISGDFERAI
jgi:Flp pilus assembly protein TadD